MTGWGMIPNLQQSGEVSVRLFTQCHCTILLGWCRMNVIGTSRGRENGFIQLWCPARNYFLKPFLLFTFLFRHGSSGEGTRSVARTAPPNVRAAKERRERASVLPSALLWIIVSFPYAWKT